MNYSTKVQTQAVDLAAVVVLLWLLLRVVALPVVPFSRVAVAAPRLVEDRKVEPPF